MKVVFVGLGGIGQRHMRNLRAILGDKVEIIACRARGFNHVLTDHLTVLPNVNLEDSFNLRVTKTLDEALLHNPAAVFITNPTSHHMDVALSAANAGVNLFVEKPLSQSMDRVEELQEAVKNRNLVSLVGYNLRFHPCIRATKTLLDDGVIGQPVAVRLQVGDYLPGWHTYEDYRQMYAARRELGGGVVLSQIHELDLAYWFFGMPRRVFALGGHLTHLEVDVEDTASILLECCWKDRPLPVHVQLDFIQRPSNRTIDIVGDNGRIEADVANNQVTLFVADEKSPRVLRFEKFERNHMFMDQMKHFLSCLRREQDPIVPISESLQSLRLALAVLRSIETRQIIEL